MLSHFERVNSMMRLHGKKLEKAMALAHRKTATSLVAGRNIVAGYARGWGLQFGTLVDVVQEDPLYQETLGLIEDLRRLHSYSLMNLFLILKYGIKDFQGDIIDTGNNGLSAFFIAYIARTFGFRGTVYALDIFQDLPHLEEHRKNAGLTNLVFVKGSFVDKAPHVLKQAQPIILAHLDCNSYTPLKKAIALLKPAMHPLGGYFLFKDSLRPQSSAAFQAAEEFVEEEKVHAEQNFPHLVYRFPMMHLGNTPSNSEPVFKVAVADHRGEDDLTEVRRVDSEGRAERKQTSQSAGTSSILAGADAEEMSSDFLNQFFIKLHNDHAFVVQGRNVTAGCARGIGIYSDELHAILEKDPIYQHAYELAAPRTVVGMTRLKNIFLILKYGLKETSGDIVELGSYRGGSALFMAQVARELGLTKTIYALDTFEGMPGSDNAIDLHQKNDFHEAHLRELKVLIRKHKLTNLVPLKGLFEKTVPKLLSKISSVALAHVDCDIYPSVHYSITALTPHMDPAGGYLILDDPLTASCIGAMQAVEELLPAQGYRAEQVYPHLVYRVPKLKN